MPDASPTRQRLWFPPGMVQVTLIKFILIAALVFFGNPPVIHAGGTPSAGTVFIFEPDGTLHCENSTGITLDHMEQRLASYGIKIFSRRKGYDGREGIAVCGAPTGQINIYEISFSDLAKALELGFRQLSENWIRTNP